MLSDLAQNNEMVDWRLRVLEGGKRPMTPDEKQDSQRLRPQDEGNSMNDQRYVVITSDAHAGPNFEAYREYCPLQYLAVFEDQLEQVKGQRANVLRIAHEKQGYYVSSDLEAAVGRSLAVAGG